MKIAILTMGTRGDVQPYAVLGRALKNRGHEVTLSTAKNFESMVKSYGLNFVPVEADFQEMVNSEEGKQMLKGNPFVIFKKIKTWVYPVIADSLTKFYSLALDSDLVLYHVKTLADAFADQFQHKMIRTNLLPIIEPTASFANPAFSGLPIPKIFYKISYTFSNLSIKLLSNPIGKFREKFSLPKKFKLPEIQNIYALSTHFLDKPKEYSEKSIFTGFWFDEGNDPLPQDLKSFIDAGAPPLLITFGSMPFKSNLDLQGAVQKIAETYNVRIILVKGWGIDNTPLLETNPNVKVVDAIPYDKVFPHVKAVIHHGGIGTTAECLRAGKPFLICPILYPVGDQQFWGSIANKKGIAVEPLPISKITEKKLLSAVEKLLNNQELYTNAQKLKNQIANEYGLENALNFLESFLG